MQRLSLQALQANKVRLRCLPHTMIIILTLVSAAAPYFLSRLFSLGKLWVQFTGVWTWLTLLLLWLPIMTAAATPDTQQEKMKGSCLGSHKRERREMTSRIRMNHSGKVVWRKEMKNTWKLFKCYGSCILFSLFFSDVLGKKEGRGEQLSWLTRRHMVSSIPGLQTKYKHEHFWHLYCWSKLYLQPK